LSDGDKVIVDGVQALHDGSPITLGGPGAKGGQGKPGGGTDSSRAGANKQESGKNN